MSSTGTSQTVYWNFGVRRGGPTEDAVNSVSRAPQIHRPIVTGPIGVYLRWITAMIRSATPSAVMTMPSHAGAPGLRPDVGHFLRKYISAVVSANQRPFQIFSELLGSEGPQLQDGRGATPFLLRDLDCGVIISIGTALTKRVGQGRYSCC